MKLHWKISPLFFALTLCLAFAQGSSDAWLMFRHDAAHSGYSTSTAPNTNRVEWRFRTFYPIHRSSPAVAYGKVYIGAYYNVYAIDEVSGNQVWSCTLSNIVSSSSPAVADGKVFIGSYDKNVYALDASTGNKIWSYATGGIVESSPTIAYGMVYVGSGDSYVYALNIFTGQKVWSYKTGGYVYSSVAVFDGKVYFGSGDKYVY
ncbi:MAG: PQQ-binding-like beta-propeller repeat protein, partial [Candidatus Bathyarchaeia archaeon]